MMPTKPKMIVPILIVIEVDNFNSAKDFLHQFLEVHKDKDELYGVKYSFLGFVQDAN